MTSSQKRKQARRNGAKAAGTKSPAGIQNSAKNSLKHGLTGKAIVLTNESQAQFDELHEAYVVEFQPESTIEMDLVDQMVAAQWRLRRIWRLQTAALDLKMDQQEAEIAKSFKQIDQCTRTAVAFTALANDDKALDLFLKVRDRLHPHAPKGHEQPLQTPKRKITKRPRIPIPVTRNYPNGPAPGVSDFACEELPAEIPFPRSAENPEPLCGENC